MLVRFRRQMKIRQPPAIDSNSLTTQIAAALVDNAALPGGSWI
jgi:hypothetical protein